MAGPQTEEITMSELSSSSPVTALMWPKKSLALLIALWLVLDYRLYALLDRHAYPAVALLIVIAGLALAARYGIKEVQLRLPRWDDWRLVTLMLAALAITLIPLGLAMGFLHFQPTLQRLQRTLIEAIPIFIIVALPEEIIFRGAIQHTLQRRWHNQTMAIAATAALFGLAHLHKGGPFPNWRYAVLAVVAGLGYGIAFARRGLMVSSLTHALVDILWRVFFR